MNIKQRLHGSFTLIMGVLTLALLPESSAEVRTWTSSDGRTVEAEFVSGDETSVTIKREDKEFTLALDNISKTDQEYVQQQLIEAQNLDLGELGEYEKYATGDWVKGEIEGLQFQIHAPNAYKRDEPVPLVIFLHGIGERGDDNEKQMNGWPKIFATPENQAKRPSIIVVPQCPLDKQWNIHNVVEQVVGLTEDLAENLPVDKDRLYLTGYSMGGFGTWAVLGNEPELFAAAIPIAGGGNPSMARAMKNVPIWNFHGEKDDVVAVSSSRKMVEALEEENGNITYTELEGAGHGIADTVLKDEKVHEWLFNQSQK
jgi:predicted peptidase